MIQPASPVDYAAIADLNVRAYSEFASSLEPGGWEMMQKNLRNIQARAEKARFLVARDGIQLIGSVAYCPPGNGDPAIFKPEWGALLLLAVDPAHRGKGIARELASVCVSMARHDGAQSIALFTSELMHAGQRLYQSLGFQLESELPMRLGVRYFRYLLSFNERVGEANEKTE